MSVIVRGMEMPEACEDCPISDVSFAEECTYFCLAARRDTNVNTQSKPDWCPLEELKEEP